MLNAWSFLAGQAAAAMASFVAIAQTKARSSRAMATQTTLAGLPARTSRRYLEQSRACAFQAISLIAWKALRYA
jgi:hypothetical protein